MGLKYWELTEDLEVYKYHFGETNTYLKISSELEIFLAEHQVHISDFFAWFESGGDKWKTSSSHWWSLEALELLFKPMVAIQTQITAIKITDSMNTIVTIQTFNHQSNSPNQWYVIRKAALITQQPKTLLPLHHCKNALTKEGECLKNRLRTVFCSHDRWNSLPKGMR